MKIEELEKRLLVLEEIEEIKKLHRQYMWWINNNQWDEIINCFTEDATAQTWIRPSFNAVRFGSGC